MKSTVGNMIAGGVRFWLMGESLGGGGDVLGVRKTVRTNPSPVACLNFSAVRRVVARGLQRLVSTP